MFTAIIAFLQAVPAILGGVNSFVSKYYDAKVQITAARIGGNVEVAKALVSGVVAEGQTRVEFLKAVSQSKFLIFIVGGFASPWMFYQAKVVMWDKIVCKWVFGVYGYTPPVDGTVGTWAGWIIGGIFGTGGLMAIGHAYFNRRDQ